MNTVTLLPGQDRRVRSGHLWIFSNEIRELDRHLAPGADVRVLDSKGRLLGSGTFNPRSLIAVRLHALFEERLLDEELIRERILAACSARTRLLGEAAARACRLVNAEGDFLPGLVVDRYEDCLVVQCLTAAMDRRQGAVADALKDLFSPSCILVRNDAPVRALEGLEETVQVAFGKAPERVSFRLEPLSLVADIVRGQKTGFYFDQRGNYELIRTLSDGAKMLDAFCYTGAWGLHGAFWGAQEVLAVDEAQHALEIGRENARRNGLSNLRFERAEVLETLKGLAARSEPFDLVVLDPPALARSKQRVREAWQGHLNLHKWALRCLKAGGWLVTCCCSAHIEPGQFLASLALGARQAGRRVKIVASRGQGPDHPWVPAMPETAYLKVHLVHAL